MANQQAIKDALALKGIENYTALEALRIKDIYVWAFPIRYPEKTTSGWEYELPDGRTSWYDKESITYEDALSEGIAAVKSTINESNKL
jgi:hypothetical protein